MSLRVALGGAAQQAADRVVPGLVEARIASAVMALDPTLWGAEAEAVAARRLGWTEAVATSRPLLAEVGSLAARLQRDGVEHVMLIGDRGAGLAARTICSTVGAALTTLDPGEADPIGAVPSGRLSATALVVASVTGAAPEADTAVRAFETAFRDAGTDPARRIVVVAPPGSPLDTTARRNGYRFFPADPTIGDRFSALSALALVPSGLAGADIGELLDEAESEELNLALDDRSNPGLVLGAAITAAAGGVLAIVADGTHVVGLDAMLEHLVAASLGNDGAGVPAVALPHDAGVLAEQHPDVQVVRLVGDAHDDALRNRREAGEILLSGTLGELLLVWHVAVAVAGHVLGIDPFDDVDAGPVASAARARLDAMSPSSPGPAPTP